MKAAIVCAGLAGLFFATQAQAVTPVLSGKYQMNYVRVCQPGIAVSFGAGVVTQVVPTNSGAAVMSLLIANFDPGTSTVTIKGNQLASTLLTATENGAPDGGSAPAFSAVNFSGPYSLADSGATINSVNYQAVYGQPKKGIVQSAGFLGIDGNTANCMVNIYIWK